MTNDFDITEFEEWALTFVRDTLSVSGNVYSDRPKVLSAKCDDFAVVRVSGRMVDEAAYGRCTLAVDLFSRDISGRKNGKKLSVMYKKLIAGFPAETGRFILSGVPVVIGDVADDYGYHARMVQIKTIIKTQ